MSIDKKTIKEKQYGNVIVSKSVKSYANDPLFVEKLEKAKKTLSNATFPYQLKK